LVAAILAALALAAPAAAAPPTVTAATATEGDALSIPVTHKCGKTAKCSYSLTTANGTAVAPGDYTTTTATGKAKKRKRFSTTVTVPTTEDTVCETTETLTLKATLTRKGTSTSSEAVQTINDDDCTGALAPAGSAQPAPPNALPAPPQGAVVESKRTEKGLTQTCTNAGVGTPSGTSFTLPPCSVYVWCPTSAKSCSATGGSLVVTNSPVPENVVAGAKASLNQQPPKPLNEAACAQVGGCEARVAASPLTPGQFYQLDCTGSHSVGTPPPNVPPQQITPATTRCSAEIEYTL
jgi:hypothetical protein